MLLPSISLHDNDYYRAVFGFALLAYFSVLVFTPSVDITVSANCLFWVVTGVCCALQEINNEAADIIKAAQTRIKEAETEQPESTQRLDVPDVPKNQPTSFLVSSFGRITSNPVPIVATVSARTPLHFAS